MCPKIFFLHKKQVIFLFSKNALFSNVLYLKKNGILPGLKHVKKVSFIGLKNFVKP